MSSAELANTLWGKAAVARALAHPAPAALTADLRAEIARHLADDAGLAAWGRGLDGATFASVVRLVTGETRDDLLAAMEAENGGGAH